ncbi:GNAT superfamily N-acetyltransferase [Paenarthrobacter nitroguajacolicus]|uniref:GNAT family N-acetyltransferase n=1 Tax=Paenarthrobacter nitroguajacolicus TaxID=211146 RepID=UPI002861E393|nr:GNAT family N-acetyltransferase [Paenarthrobacter nitroguajacolicus]MDR6986873.1 GNAT superfamily N-acetyltransferase [Paenarthrobacter nitroguajacolicus]
MIRLAHADDLLIMQDIERAAGQAFRALGMDLVADDEPLTVDQLHGYAVAGRAWVYVDGLDYPVAYLLADIVDGAGHVEQVSVHPDYAHQGLGRELLHAARVWTRGHGMQRQTLSTFRDVPWNAPYYRRLGFEVLDAGSWGPQLTRLMEHEAGLGLTHWPRVAMWRPAVPPT